MQFRSFVVATILAAGCFAQSAWAAEQRQIELFGVTLKGGARDQLRQAFKKNGLKVTREDNGYWVDIYNAEEILEGASEFQVGYVAASGKFAYAQYTFPSFMDTQLVGKVIKMVSIKYGRPSSQQGNYGLGEVVAKWTLGQDMQIVVSRGWPETTTFLQFIDVPARRQMNLEIDAEMNAQATQKARSQNKAF